MRNCLHAFSKPMKRGCIHCCTEITPGSAACKGLLTSKIFSLLSHRSNIFHATEHVIYKEKVEDSWKILRKNCIPDTLMPTTPTIARSRPKWFHLETLQQTTQKETGGGGEPTALQWRRIVPFLQRRRDPSNRQPAAEPLWLVASTPPTS